MRLNRRTAIFDLLRVEHEYSVVKYACVEVDDDDIPTDPDIPLRWREKESTISLLGVSELLREARWNCQTSRYFADSTSICQKVTVLDLSEGDDRSVIFKSDIRS